MFKYINCNKKELARQDTYTFNYTPGLDYNYFDKGGKVSSAFNGLSS